MKENYTVLSDVITKEAFQIDEEFATDILLGLSKPEKKIPSKYFYDKKGSELFTAITHLEEYYPTKCELEILTNNARKIRDVVGKNIKHIVELGAGDERKASILLDEFLKDKQDFIYHPVDISESAVEHLTIDMKKKYPAMKCNGIVAEYFQAIKWINGLSDGQKLVLFLGSNIGNYSNNEASSFLRLLWNKLNPNDYLLIGVDLKKDLRVLQNAYDDSKGVTQEFNLNILDRINRELGADFKRENFQHSAYYNCRLGAMESHIVSKVDQSVNISSLNKIVKFDAYEGIHLEYSHKYLVKEINALLDGAGFIVRELLFDSNKYFVNIIAEVKKD